VSRQNPKRINNFKFNELAKVEFCIESDYIRFIFAVSFGGENRNPFDIIGLVLRMPRN